MFPPAPCAHRNKVLDGSVAGSNTALTVTPSPTSICHGEAALLDGIAARACLWIVGGGEIRRQDNLEQFAIVGPAEHGVADAGRLDPARARFHHVRAFALHLGLE